ncbi:MAG: transglycosylase SLT domain-containing protein [Myxococcales bacterium]|nr:transglycosylase SLT domain-containing protein [Myxococcales bacterium]
MTSRARQGWLLASVALALVSCARPDPSPSPRLEPGLPTEMPPTIASDVEDALTGAGLSPRAVEDASGAPSTDGPGDVAALVAAADGAATAPTDASLISAADVGASDLAPKATPGDAVRTLAPWFEGAPARAHWLAGRYAEAAVAFAALSVSGSGDPAGDPSASRAAILSALAAARAGDVTAPDRLLGLLGRVPLLDGTLRVVAAETYAAAGQHEKALAALGSGGPGHFPDPVEAQVLEARTLTALGRHADAARTWREYIARHDAHDRRSLEAAEAIARVGGDSERDVARILRGVIARAPHSSAAIDAEARLASLPQRLRSLTMDELLVRLESQIERRATEPALKTAAQVEKASRAGTLAACKSAALEARALDRARRRKALVDRTAALQAACPVTAVPTDEAGVAIAAARAEIHYLAGKAHRSRGDAVGAIRLFSMVPDVAPDSSLADDALVAAAALLRKSGRERAADVMLDRAMTLGGDQEETAAFDLFWGHWTAGRFDQAGEVARRASQSLSPSSLLRARGRLPYWYARALERRGDPVAAGVAYAGVVQRYPLTWYSVLAMSRLEALDPGAAAAARTAARPPGNPTGPLARALSVRENPDVALGIELLRLDFGRVARRAFEAASDAALEDDGDRDWLRAWVYDQLGDHVSAYRIARWGRHEEHTAEFPWPGQDAAWRIANPRPASLMKAVAKAATDHGLEEAAIWAVMQTESGFRPEVHSSARAVGLMQLILPTGRSMAKREGITAPVSLRTLQDPDLNIRLGTRYLRRLQDRLGAHLPLIAAGYNAGPGRPLKWLELRGDQELDEFVENIPYNETRKYVKSVMTAYVRYRYLYTGAEPPTLPLALPLLSQVSPPADAELALERGGERPLESLDESQISDPE